MIENNSDSVSSDLGDVEANQQTNDSSKSSNQDNSTGASEDAKEEISEISDAVNSPNNQNVAGSAYRDTQRTTPRANEATDRLDSGSGGLSAGGEKSASGF